MDELRRQKIDLVWAGVFVSCFAVAGLALLLTFADGATLDTIAAIDLIGSGVLSMVTVVLLLTIPAGGKTLLVIGRVLIWLALLTLFVAGCLGSLSIAGVG